MKVLDTILLVPKKNCVLCGGKGYILKVRADLDAERFREVRPCPKCMKQVIKISEEE